jgi:hypothetical protein
MEERMLMKNSNFKIIFMLIIFFGIFSLVKSSQAATYYIDNKITGCNFDANGKSTAANYDPKTDTCGVGNYTVYNHPQRVSNDASVMAGDHIIVADGKYSDTVNLNGVTLFLRNTGTPNNWITWEAENKHGAVFDCGNSVSTMAIDYNSHVSYIEIKGFKIINCGWGISNNAQNHDLRYLDNDISNFSRNGIGLGSADGSSPAWSTYNVLIERNVIHDILYGTGIGGYAIYPSGHNITIINNIFYNNAGKWYIHIGRPCDTVNDGSNIKIISNTFHGAAVNTGDIVLWRRYSCSGNEQFSNLFIENNIFSNPNTASIYIYANNLGNSTNYVRNNLVYGGDLIYLCSSCSSYTHTSSENIMGSDPKFKDSALHDYSLLEGSPAINAGLSDHAPDVDFIGTHRPQGAGFDIGAHEYVSTSGPKFFYITPNGIDNAGCTITTPCKTIAHASAKLSSGDTLYLRGGLYILPNNGEYFPAGISGNAVAPITIKNYPGETPILTNQYGIQSGGSGLMFQNQGSQNQWIIIEGLEFTGIKWVNLFLQYANNIVVKNCNFHDTGGIAAGVIDIGGHSDSAAHHFIVENNSFTNTGVTDPDLNQAHAVYVDNGASNITIRNNYFRDTHNGATIHVYGNTAPRPHDVDIYNNIFYLSSGQGRTALQVYSPYTSEIYNVVAYANTIYLNCLNASLCYAFDTRTNGVNNKVWNNIIYFANKPDGNIILTSGASYVAYDYNLYYPSKDFDDTGIHSITGNPLFTNISAGTSLGLKILVGSPAIDAGLSNGAPVHDFYGNPRPQGSGYDIGAYEYDSASLAYCGDSNCNPGETCFSCSQDCSTCPSKNPIVHWNLDETSGTTTYDSSGNKHGTLLGNPSRARGINGSAILFDGTDDRISFGDPADGSLDFGTGSFSYGLWVFVNSSVGSYDISFWKGGSSPSYPGYDFELGTGSWSVNLNDGSTGAQAIFGQESEFLNKWTLLFAVIDRNSSQLRTYVNGIQKGTTTISSLGSVSTTSSATIGSTSWGSFSFKGRIDDVRIYNYVLPPSEILNLYFSFFHRSDINKDSCTDTTELSTFINRWKTSSIDVPIRELIETIGLWKKGC